MITDPPAPRRKWHFARWLIVFIVAVFGWGGWRAYAFRSALAEADALGWTVEYTDPVETIRKKWKDAFKKETWLDGVLLVRIPTSEAFGQHVATVDRLNPKGLILLDSPKMRDLSTLNGLTRLQWIRLYRCTELTNLDALKTLSALQHVYLHGCPELTNLDALNSLPALDEVYLHYCTGLTNVDALKNLSGLQWISLIGCTGLTPDAVASLKAALPNAKITGP